MAISVTNILSIFVSDEGNKKVPNSSLRDITSTIKTNLDNKLDSSAEAASVQWNNVKNKPLIVSTINGIEPDSSNNVAITKVAQADNATHASSSDSATKATQDASGNVITTTYATNTQLTQGLADKAPNSHTHTKAQITDFPAIPDTSTLIPKNGDRGVLNGIEAVSSSNLFGDIQPESLPDSVWCTLTMLQMHIKNPASTNLAFTKVIFGTGSGGEGITLDTQWKWPNGNAISYKDAGFVVVLHYNNGTGIVNLINY